MVERFLGIDVGAETVKVVELCVSGDVPAVGRRWCVEHHKDPSAALRRVLVEADWATVRGAAATGRASRNVELERVPTKAALASGVRHRFPGLEPATVVSIGAHGFGVLELRPSGDVYRENSRCSQGTGNFLRQLVERFELTVEEASELCADVATPAALSGRCPVILKTDMTHLANKGEDRAAIVAGLYDAVCENVRVLVKPRLSPPRVLLAGGVMRARRVSDNFRRHLAAQGMELVEADTADGLDLEALGAAVVATRHARPLPTLDALFADHDAAHFEAVPALRAALGQVVHMPPLVYPPVDRDRTVALGFDIGSTGSKALAVDLGDGAPIWEGYLNTSGDPVGAARKLAGKFLDATGGRYAVGAIGATGSGREIVGSLMRSCFGSEPVFVLNEIAAHAEGALSFDPKVDTIFEIGGQDAKYIRLDNGRISDAAMNEACSAGTGSFIAEQGSKFAGIDGVAHLGEVALGADGGVSLGQHCSVFMAEVIDEAVAAGVPQPRIIAGIYDSIIQNYLNRVKGNRSVGDRIFCQGMPFRADALAAAVARQTGRTVIVPPIPGTIGALGIALLARREVVDATRPPLDLAVFLTATVEDKDVFVCKSTKGCGGAGNRCKIDRIQTRVAGRKQKFLWGGNCSLFDRGTNRRKLPDLAPDPFRERDELARAFLTLAAPRPDAPRVALPEEFALKGLMPFFATFVHRLGFDVKVYGDGTHRHLKRGIEAASVPFCAPMQLYQGVIETILDDAPDILIAPRLRELPRQRDEAHAVTCPIVQASPDLVRRAARSSPKTRIVTPRIDIGPGNLASTRFRDSARRLAEDLGAGAGWQDAFAAAAAAQRLFDDARRAIGVRALAFARARQVVPVVVLGRPYTIYNDVLNSNVPNLLREQGAMAIPVDCYPIDDDAPIFDGLYWGYGQLNIRAAHQIRRADGVYAVYCSNYSCGPDSFTLHFFTYAMEHKPFAIIETDGHSGDAGTKTRLEAFLFCVEGDRRLSAATRAALPRRDFRRVDGGNVTVGAARAARARVLIPRMGPNADVIAAVMCGEGLRAEALPMPSRATLRLGRRYTSGKECVPMTLTAGSLLARLDELAAEAGPDERFAFFMPSAGGPCRFGVYNLFHKILLEQTGWRDRVDVISPDSSDYFKDVSADFQIRASVAAVASDLLLAALHDVRPVERRPGAAQRIYDRHVAELIALFRGVGPGGLARGLAELSSGAFGVRALLARAAAELRRVKDPTIDLPTVSVVGEIYVRLDPFANDFVVEKLEARGLKAAMAPFNEWLEYMNHLRLQRLDEGRGLPTDRRFHGRVVQALQARLTDRLYRVMADALGWAPRTTVADTVRAAAPYVSAELFGEAVLTVGGPVHEYLHGAIDGVVAVGPHECMPNKIAEAQLAHVTEDHGLIALTLPVNGSPIVSEQTYYSLWRARAIAELKRRSKK
ncbi:MAG: CoA activase [Myxococcales bacterium]|nr:CoA activase [Myxococcales bacterium]